MTAGTVARRAISEGYEHCRVVTRREAKNFYYGFLMLPPARRNAIYAAYAFARMADDAVDEERPFDDKVALLARLRQQLAEALADEPTTPAFVALADAAGRFSIPHEYFYRLIDGCEMDLTISSYETWEGVREYCYSVASITGLISLEIFGYDDPRARDYAADLGLALQLTNILRDIREDCERDRIYLPMAEIREFGYSPEELQAGVVNEAFKRLMAHQVARARAHYESGYKLLPLLDARARACCGVMAGIYSRILHAIEASGYDVFSTRASVGTATKLRVMGQQWLGALLPRRPASPDVTQ